MWPFTHRIRRFADYPTIPSLSEYKPRNSCRHPSRPSAEGNARHDMQITLHPATLTTTTIQPPPKQNIRDGGENKGMAEPRRNDCGARRAGGGGGGRVKNEQPPRTFFGRASAEYSRFPRARLAVKRAGRLGPQTEMMGWVVLSVYGHWSEVTRRASAKKRRTRRACACVQNATTENIEAAEVCRKCFRRFRNSFKWLRQINDFIDARRWWRFRNPILHNSVRANGIELALWGTLENLFRE